MKYKDFKKLNEKDIVNMMTDEDVKLIDEIEKETGDDLPYKFYAESYMDTVDLAKFEDNEEINFSITEYLEYHLDYIVTLKNINE